MTGKLKQRLIFGLLAWGLFAFSASTVNAGIINWGAGTSQDVRDTYRASQIREQGQAGVDSLMKEAGYESSNVRAVTNDDIKQKLDSAREVNTLGEHWTGATNAAAARWKGSRNWFTGAFNVVAGATADLFRNSYEIEESLKDYANGENAENIAKATGAANALQQQNDDLEAAKKAVAVYETQDGQKIYMDEDMKSIGGLMDGCIPLPLKLEESKKCILCPLFKILFNTAQTMSKASYDTLARGFKNLLLIGFALYVAYVTLKQVSAFTKQDGPKYVSDLLTMSFKVLLAYLILTHVQQLYDLVLSPMLSAAMDFGGAFLFRGTAGGEGGTSYSRCLSVGAMSGVASGFYSATLFSKIDCFVQSIQQELAVATSVGSSLMCVSHNEASHWYGLPDLTMLFSGLIIWVFSWLVCLAFGFYLIDSVVRLGVVGGLMPFLIAAWPFKLTSGYTKKGWDMFMNAFFTFVFLGLVVSVNIELSMQAMSGGEGSSQEIMNLINKNEVKPILEIMSIGLMGLLFLILCCVFGFKLCAEAVSLASQMGGGSGGTIGSTIASMGAGFAKWGSTKTLKGAGSLAKEVGEGMGVNDKIRAGKEAVGGMVYKGASWVGRKLHLKGTGSGGRGIGSSGGESDESGVSARAQNSGRNEDKDQRKVKGGIGRQLNSEREAAEGDASQPTDIRTAQNGAVAGDGATGGRNNSSARGGNRSENGDRDEATGATAESTAQQNPNQENDASATPERGNGDNGASEAGPRNETPAEAGAQNGGGDTSGMKDKANQIVGDAKQKIAAEAQNAAKGGAVEQTRKYEKPDSGKKDDKNNKEHKKDQARIAELQKRIGELEALIDKQEKMLKMRAGGVGAAGVDSATAEQLKKLKEEKDRLKAELSNQLNSKEAQK